MKTFLLTVFLLLEISVLLGQSSLLWSRDADANLANYYSNKVSMNTDSDLISVHGILNLPGSAEQKLQIVTYNLNGDTLSTVIFGTDLLLQNTITDYDFDNFGNVYIVHNEKLEYYKSKIVLQKYAANGSLLWSVPIESPEDISHSPVYVQVIEDSRIHLAYHKEQNYPEFPTDVYETVTTSGLITFNLNGDVLWNRFFDPLTEINYFSVDMLANSEYVYVFAIDGRMLQINQIGDVILNVDVPLTHSVWEVQFTNDNSLMIGARFDDYEVTKVTMTGEVLWNYEYETNLPSFVHANEIDAMIQDDAGNVYITGRHPGEGYDTPEYTNGDVATLKIDPSGNLLWENRYIYGGNNFDGGNCLDLRNGNVYVGGRSQHDGISSEYDYLVLRIDQNSGELLGEYRYDSDLGNVDAVTDISVFDDGKVALTGISGEDGNLDWTTQLLGDVVLSTEEMIGMVGSKIYPNPVRNSEELTIVGEGFSHCKLITMEGQLLSTFDLQKSAKQNLNIGAVPSGMYLLVLEGKAKISTTRLVVD